MLLRDVSGGVKTELKQLESLWQLACRRPQTLLDGAQGPGQHWDSHPIPVCVCGRRAAAAGHLGCVRCAVFSGRRLRAALRSAAGHCVMPSAPRALLPADGKGLRGLEGAAAAPGERPLHKGPAERLLQPLCLGGKRAEGG